MQVLTLREVGEIQSIKASHNLHPRSHDHETGELHCHHTGSHTDTVTFSNNMVTNNNERDRAQWVKPRRIKLTSQPRVFVILETPVRNYCSGTTAKIHGHNDLPLWGFLPLRSLTQAVHFLVTTTYPYGQASVEKQHVQETARSISERQRQLYGHMSRRPGAARWPGNEHVHCWCEFFEYIARCMELCFFLLFPFHSQFASTFRQHGSITWRI